MGWFQDNTKEQEMFIGKLHNDYNEDLIFEFIEEHYQNLNTVDENIHLFKEWQNE